ncbi:MAG: hypothetical protein ABH828_02765 [archaeon]
MDRRAQTEIMGLIVIVVLLTLGMLFTISLKSTQPKKEIKKTFNDDQLSSNFILAFLETSTGCKNYNMENMIQDCAVENNTPCDGMNSCDYLNKTMDTFLKKTLDVWGTKYGLRIEGLPMEIKFNSTCGPNDDKDTTFQPVSLSRYGYFDTVTVWLDICE